MSEQPSPAMSSDQMEGQRFKGGETTPPHGESLIGSEKEGPRGDSFILSSKDGDVIQTHVKLGTISRTRESRKRERLAGRSQNRGGTSGNSHGLQSLSGSA